MPDDARASALAEARRCHGVITTRRAAELGVTRAQLRTDLARGQWLRSAPGVLVSASAPDTWIQRLAVASLSSGGPASHRSAARLHGLDGAWGEVLEVTVARPTRARRPWIVHQTTRLEDSDLVVVDGVRSTGLARTLVDLGAVVGDDLVEQALDDAMRRGTSLRWVEATLWRLDRPGPSGTAALRRVLERPDRRGPLPDSTFERLIERAAAEAGIPPPQRQFRVLDGTGSTVAVLDAAWPDRRIGSEAQSERWHGGPRGAQRDLDRHNRLTALGWHMLYATWADAREPSAFVRRLVELHRHLR